MVGWGWLEQEWNGRDGGMDGDWTRSEHNLAKCDDNVRGGRTCSHALAESNAGTIGMFSPLGLGSVRQKLRN